MTRMIGPMTNGARQLLESFDALPEAEKHEVLVELLRRVSYGSPSDDDLTRLTGLVFRQYDEQEHR
jgi:hypothetical protein